MSKKIYGGYNPIGYVSSREGWVSSSNSFIFSFENDQDIYNEKIGRVIVANYSVTDACEKYFFCFGNHLYITRQNLYLSNPGFYNDIFNIFYDDHFELPIEEIEVLSLVKI